MYNLLWSGFIFMLLLSGCGWDGTPTRSNDFIPLTSIEIVADASTIAMHTSTGLSVKGNFSGQFTRDITDQVLWMSSNPTVAGFVTPAIPNRVTGQAPGSAILTATVGKVTSTFTLTISTASVTRLTITPAATSLAKGLSSQLYVNGDFSDGTTQNLTFDADWASTDPDVATVSNSAGNKGLAQAIAVGSATITATFAANGVSNSTVLTVTAPALQSITVSPANATLLSLSRRNFTAIGAYSDGSTANITSQAVWRSSGIDIASVATGGAVKTISPGTVSISATLDGVNSTAGVKVTGGSLTGITLSPTNPVLVKDTTRRLSASGTFSNGSIRDISGTVDWSVDSANVATVTTPGGNQAWLTPLLSTAGATVTARSGQITAETVVTVIAPQLQSIAIAPTPPELTVGTSRNLAVIATFNDGTTRDVTARSDWTSNAASIATVGNVELADRGRVRGGAAGFATISAAYGGLTATVQLTVRSRILKELTIGGATALVVGNQVTFTATASFTDNTSEAVTADCAWSIDNPNVAILADNLIQPGQVIMVDGGFATLQASFGGNTKTVTLTSQSP